MDSPGAAQPATIFEMDLFQLAQRAFEAYPETVSFDNFGPYTLQQSLGKGGMGEVFLAHDAIADRRVAIKFLYNLWSEPGIQERFSREIQNLAKLEHPFIARLYDAGIHPSGTPYFAMEYVPGMALDSYCSGRQVSIASRLNLFHYICQAVEYAHTHLIVHCDLKPSNILVENDRMLKLVDFGVSRKLVPVDASARQTQTLMGFTPVFAAPEQVRGEAVGLYTDVYALGVVLYQLLTGSLPGNAHSPAEAQRYLDSDREPEKPSVLARKSAAYSGISRSAWADLDVLCLTALKKRPAQRYGSVSALTRDLEQYLAGKPLAAQPDSFRYHLGKFVRRNRFPVAITVSTVLLIASLVALFTLRITRERDRANLETAATAAMNRFLTEDLLAQANPFQSGTSQQTFVDAVAQAAPRINVQFASQPLIAGRLHQAIGEAFDGRFDLARARSEYILAEHLFQQADGPYSQDAVDVTLRRAALEARFFTAANLAAAQSTLTSAQDSLRHISHPRADLPIREKYDRAVLAVVRNDFAAANRDFAAALSEAMSIPAFPPRELLRIREAYAYSCERTGDPKKAESLFRQVIATYNSFGETDTPSVLRARAYHAQSLQQQSLYSQALAEANAIYPSIVQKLGPTHDTTYTILGTRAAAEGSLGFWGDAIRDDRAMYQITAQKQGPNSMIAAEALADTALSQCRSGQYAEGEPNARRAFAIAKQNAGPGSTLAGAVAYTVATCLCLSNKLDEATAVLKTINVPAVTQLVGDPSFPAGVLLSEADIAFRRGDFALARQKLAAAAPAFQNPDTDLFERQRLARLQKSLSR